MNWGNNAPNKFAKSLVISHQNLWNMLKDVETIIKLGQF